MNKEKTTTILRKSLILLLIILIATAIIITTIFLYHFLNTNQLTESEITQLSKCLEINSNYYDGIIESTNTTTNIKVSQISDLELNKQIASYVITNIIPNIDYDYNTCPTCYKYFSQDDTIRFYNPEEINSIYEKTFGKPLKKITAEDVVANNIIYYNKEINMYYINIIPLNTKPNIISKFKEYIKNNNEMYLDYYYLKIEYQDDNRIFLLDHTNNYSNQLYYNEFFDENNQIININNYLDYFDTIRYTYTYNKTTQTYTLNNINILT